MVKDNIPADPAAEQVDELVEMLDRLMSQGDGHVNVTVQGGGGLDVTTSRSSDCGTGACCQPNESCADPDDDMDDE